MIFISFYLLFVRVEGVTDMDSRLNQADGYMERASDDCNGLLVFKNNGRSIERNFGKTMNSFEIQQAHFYILQNCEEVRPWIK